MELRKSLEEQSREAKDLENQNKNKSIKGRAQEFRHPIPENEKQGKGREGIISKKVRKIS